MATAKNKGGRPPKFKTPKDLETAIDKYFEDTIATGKAPTWADMLVKLNIADRTLLTYRTNEDGKHEGYSDIIKKAEHRHCNFWQQYALDHPNLQSFCMFELKQPHNGGFSDKQQVEGKQDIKIDFCINGTQSKPKSSK